MVTAIRPISVAEAFPPAEYIGQESFMTASEILALARAAGVARDTRVLDLCCGTGGPARFLTETTGCRLVGVDRSTAAIARARALSYGRRLQPQPQFLVGAAGSLPLAARFDTVLIFDSIVAIKDKAKLLQEVRCLLRRGGRFGLTLDEGLPLSPEEQRPAPEGRHTWLIPEATLLGMLRTHGFAVCERENHSQGHLERACQLLAVFKRERAALIRALGAARYEHLSALYRQWRAWLGGARVRSLAFVLERVAPDYACQATNHGTPTSIAPGSVWR